MTNEKGDFLISQSKITVRYAETDKMAIVHHSNYPVWFEIARTNHIKQLGESYSSLEKRGLMLPLIELSCHYIKPAFYEDEVVISARVISLSCAKLEYYYTVERNGELLCTGKTKHGFVDSKTFKPINAKKFDPELFEKLKNSIEKIDE